MGLSETLRLERQAHAVRATVRKSATDTARVRIAAAAQAKHLDVARYAAFGRAAEPVLRRIVDDWAAEVFVPQLYVEMRDMLRRLDEEANGDNA